MFPFPVSKRWRRLGEFAAVVIGAGAVFRFWLFREILANPARLMSAGGAHNQNLSVYFYNAYAYARGQAYPTDFWQYTWYADMLGANEPSPLPSLFFAVFYSATNNYVLAFNLLVFGNLLALYLGLYYLLRYYKVRRVLAFASPLFALTSIGFQVLFEGYAHALFFAGLPLVLLALETILDFRTARVSKRWYGLYALGLASLFWASWHMLLFSSTTLILYGLWRLRDIIVHRARSWRRVLAVFGLSLLVSLPLVPLGLASIRVGRILYSSRTLSTVVGENFEALSIGYAHLPFKAYNYLASYANRLPTFQEGSFYDASPLDIHAYPGFLPSGLFWVVLVWLFWVVGRRVLSWAGVVRPTTARENRVRSALGYGVIFVILALFTFGPFARGVTGPAAERLLPYGYFYLFYYPARAVRTAWRFAGVSAVIGSVLFGLLAEFTFEALEYRLRFAPAVWRYVLRGVGVLVLGGVLVFTNRGWQDTVTPGFSFDSEIERILDEDERDTLDFFEWVPPELSFQDQRETTVFVGQYNLDRGQNRLRWVLGGGAGTYEKSTILLSRLRQDPSDYPLLVDVLAAREVDYVLATDLAEGESTVAAALARHYESAYDSERQSLWRLREKPQVETKFSVDLDYDLQGSSYVEAGAEYPLYINQQNFSGTFYLQPEVVDLRPYTFRLVRGEEVLVKSVRDLADPLFVPNLQGRSLRQTVKIPALSPGEARWELYREEELVATKAVEVVGSDVLEEISKRPRKLNFPLGVSPYRREEYPEAYLPVRLQVETGRLRTEPAKVLAWQEETVNVQFYSIRGEEYTGFPEWLVQIPCQPDLTLYAGDEVSLWCEWFLPYDSEYLFYRTELIPEASDSK